MNLIESYQAVKALEVNGYDVKALKKRIVSDILFLYEDEYLKSGLSLDSFINSKMPQGAKP